MHPFEFFLKIAVDLCADHHDIHTEVHPQKDQYDGCHASVHVRRSLIIIKIKGKSEGKCRPAHCRKHRPGHLASEGSLPVWHKFIQKKEHHTQGQQGDGHSHADDHGHQLVEKRQVLAQLPLQTVAEDLKDQRQYNGNDKDKGVKYRPYSCHNIIPGLFYLINTVESIGKRLDSFACGPQGNDTGERDNSQGFLIHFIDYALDKGLKALGADLHYRIDHFLSVKGRIPHRSHEKEHKWIKESMIK